MKIGVSASGNTLDAQVDPRFGRCSYFMLVDSESMQFEAVPNSAATSGSGAGIQAEQTMASKHIQVLITGNVGPNAFQALSAAEITVITGVSGKVREVIEKYNKGLLSESRQSTVRGHFGMGAGRGHARNEKFFLYIKNGRMWQNG